MNNSTQKQDLFTILNPFPELPFLKTKQENCSRILWIAKPKATNIIVTSLLLKAKHR